jgi:hypothetical protein
MDWGLILQIGGVCSLFGGFVWWLALYIFNQGEKRGKERAKEDSLVTDVKAMAGDLRSLRQELSAHVQSDNERFEQIQRQQSKHSDDINRLKQRR